MLSILDFTPRELDIFLLGCELLEDLCLQLIEYEQNHDPFYWNPDWEPDNDYDTSLYNWEC